MLNIWVSILLLHFDSYLIFEIHSARRRTQAKTTQMAIARTISHPRLWVWDQNQHILLHNSSPTWTLLRDVKLAEISVKNNHFLFLQDLCLVPCTTKCQLNRIALNNLNLPYLIFNKLEENIYNKKLFWDIWFIILYFLRKKQRFKTYKWYPSYHITIFVSRFLIPVSTLFIFSFGLFSRRSSNY